MILFIKRLFLFSFILFLLFFIGLCLPSTPRTSKSLLFAKYNKDSLLANSPSPRIIFIGGSGLSFGLNSEMIKDSLGLNPINTAIHGAIGLSYMISSVNEYIRPGDIVVIAPEYQFFYGRNSYGGEELLRTVLEVSPNTIKLLSFRQWLNIYRYLPKYSFSKFKPIEYLDTRVDILYGVNSFNDFGDANVHWNSDKRGCATYEPIHEEFNTKVISELIQFKKQVQDKSALLYITFPGLQASSFEVFKDQIAKVKSELIKGGFVLLGSPERYEIADSLIFNAPYHLSKAGLDLRTHLLIEDLRSLGIKH
jgi:hypothetical protein